MALSENVKISLNIEVAKSTTDVNALKKATEELNKSLSNVKEGTKEYAEIQDALTKSSQRQNELLVEQAINYSEAAQGVGELNKAMKQLKSAQELVDKSSPKFKALQDAINKTEGRVGDLNDSFKTLTGSGMERFRSSIGLVGEGMTNLDWGKFSGGIKGATKAFGGLKGALGALGIGLIIKAVSYLIDNFDDLKNSTGLVGQVFRGIGDIITSVTSKISEFTDWIGLTNNALEKQSEKAIEGAKKTSEAVTKKYDQEIKEAEAAGKSTIKLEREKANAVLATLKIQADAIIALGKANGSFTEEQLKNLTELTEQGKQIKSDLKVAEEKDAKKQKEDKKKSNEDALKAEKDRAKNEYEELKKSQELSLLKVQQGTYDAIYLKQKQSEEEAKFLEKNKKLLEKSELDIKLIREKSAKETNDSIKTIQDKEIADNKTKNDKIAADNKIVQDTAIKDLIAGQQAILLQQQIGSQAELDAKIQLMEVERQAKLMNAQLTEGEIALINAQYAADVDKTKEEYHQKELERKKKEQEATIQTTTDTVGAIQGITDTYFAIQEANTNSQSANAEKNARKQFQANKALQLGMAVIDGFKAVTSSLSQAPVAIGPLPNPAGIASLAFAVTTSAANIAKIAGTQYKSSSSGAASTGAHSSGAGSSISPGGFQSGAASSPGNIPPQLKRVDGSLPSAANVSGSGSDSSKNSGSVVRAYIVQGDISSSNNKAEILDRKTSF